MNVLKNLNEARSFILEKRKEEEIFNAFCANVDAMSRAMEMFRITNMSDMFLNCNYIQQRTI